MRARTFAGKGLALTMTATLLGVVAAYGPADAAIISITPGAVAVGSHTGNLVLNGSFETGNTGVNLNWTGPGPHTGGSPGGPGVSIPDWTTSFDTGAYGWWGSLGFAGAPCADGVACLYFGNWFTTPSVAPTFNPDGTVTFASTPAFTNASATNAAPVVLSQLITGLTPGDTYLLDFWTSGESNMSGFSGAGIFGLNIGATDSAFLTVPSASSVFAAASIRYAVMFTADAPSELLSFTNWGHASGSATELVLDDVIINHVPGVPEPSSIALFGAGLAGLAAVRRRCKSRT